MHPIPHLVLSPSECWPLTGPASGAGVADDPRLFFALMFAFGFFCLVMLAWAVAFRTGR